VEEYFDILDESGKPSGKTALRSEVHKKGLYHRTVHIWLIKEGKLLLQRRSADKDSFPSRLDISSAGHIDAGEEPLTAAVRELSEELGISAKPSELMYVGNTERHYINRFHGEVFDDRELAFVYVYTGRFSLSDINVQESEISDTGLYTVDEAMTLAADDNEPLDPHELELLIHNLYVMDMLKNNID